MCKKVGENADHNLDIETDYKYTLEATNRGENSSTKDVIEDLYCYVEGTKFNPTAYLSTDSIVSSAISSCLLAINRIDKYEKYTRRKTL